MVAKRIIPCLDVKNGRVVKGVNFEGLGDVASPVSLAEYYSSAPLRSKQTLMRRNAQRVYSHISYRNAVMPRALRSVNHEEYAVTTAKRTDLRKRHRCRADVARARAYEHSCIFPHSFSDLRAYPRCVSF